MPSLSPVDPDKYIGSITFINATQVQANLPFASARPEQRALAKGAVGDFVFVDCERFKLLGRIVEVKIPDQERLSIEPRFGGGPTPNPVGRIQLLATVSNGNSQLARGVNSYPKIGDAVYLAGAEVLAELIGKSVTKSDEINVSVGKIEAGDTSVAIELPPEKLFGRHCGVFGATGGGKSWTIASLIERIKDGGGKAIVFDPTGEFCDTAGIDTVFAFEAVANAQHVHLPRTSPQICTSQMVSSKRLIALAPLFLLQCRHMRALSTLLSVILTFSACRSRSRTNVCGGRLTATPLALEAPTTTPPVTANHWHRA